MNELLRLLQSMKKEAAELQLRVAPPLKASTLPKSGAGEPKLLSGAKEICAFLGICPSTLYNWRRRGLPVSSPRGGKRVFIREDVLLEWIGQGMDRKEKAQEETGQ